MLMHVVEALVKLFSSSLETIEFPEFHHEGWNITKKTEFLLETSWMIFKGLIANWDLTEDIQLPAKLNELTEASILGVFATYPNQIEFFLVHGLTGNHAVRVIFPHLPKNMQRQLLKVNLLGFLTDYVAQQSPKINVNFIAGYKPTESGENMQWDNILKRTISTDEEHVLKIVRCLIYYMETVSEQSTLFNEKFLMQCAFKIVDLVKVLEDYRF